MAGSLRSRNGCWTCRLRKKKCDEIRPHCGTCETLLIPCYGYGPKPSCMDGGDEEKALLDRLKDIVRKTARRKNPQRALPPPDTQLALLKPKPLHDAARNIKKGLDALNLQDAAEKDTNNGNDRQFDHNNAAASIAAPLSAVDSILLMHYIDNVFPLQFPMHQSNMGRGWLLALLMKSKPFYHSALSLSAYLRRANSSAQSGMAITSLPQEEHLGSCIKLLRHSLEHVCCDDGVGMLAAVLHAVFFELYNEDERAWQAHLQASVNIYRHSAIQGFSHIGLSEDTRKTILEGLPMPKGYTQVEVEIEGFKCMTGTLFWLDMLSSITTERTPFLISTQILPLNATSLVQLGDIFGCENRTVLQIAQISQLHRTRSLATAAGQSDVQNIDVQASKLSIEIKSHMVKSSDLGQRSAITRIYSYLAMVYLHLVIHDFQHLDRLNKTILEAISLLQLQELESVLPVLVAPIYVLGVAAQSDNRSFFRHVLSTPPLANPALRHRAKIVSILEKVWDRRSERGFKWSDCISLSKGVLLI